MHFVPSTLFPSQQPCLLSLGIQGNAVLRSGGFPRIVHCAVLTSHVGVFSQSSRSLAASIAPRRLYIHPGLPPDDVGNLVVPRDAQFHGGIWVESGRRDR